MNDDLIRRGPLESVAEKVLMGIAEPLDLIRAISRAPAVDAVEVVRCRDCRMAAMLRKPIEYAEVKHGRWEESESGFLVCSECADAFILEEWLADGKRKYCPNCGAKMDLEEEMTIDQD